MSIHCTVDNFDRYLFRRRPTAQRRLLSCNFIITGKQDAEDGCRQLHRAFHARYIGTNYVTIYRVRDLRETCANRIKRYQSQFPHLNDFAHSQQNDSRKYVTLLNLYPVGYDDIGARQYFSYIFQDWGDLIHRCL